MRIGTYEDDPKVYAKVAVNGREIRLRSTPESDAFFNSLLALDDADTLLSATVWLEHKANACAAGPESLDTEPVAIQFRDRTIVPFSTPEDHDFAQSLSGVDDRDRLYAIGFFLHAVAEQMFDRAVDRNPEIVQ